MADFAMGHVISWTWHYWIPKYLKIIQLYKSNCYIRQLHMPLYASRGHSYRTLYHHCNVIMCGSFSHHLIISLSLCLFIPVQLFVTSKPWLVYHSITEHFLVFCCSWRFDFCLCPGFLVPVLPSGSVYLFGLINCALTICLFYGL